MSDVEYGNTKDYLQRRYQEAQKARWVAQLSSETASPQAHPGLLDHLALKTGELLVAGGLKLKEHYWIAAGRPHHFFILDLGGD